MFRGSDNYVFVQYDIRTSWSFAGFSDRTLLSPWVLQVTLLNMNLFRNLAEESTYFKGINRVCREHGTYLTFLLRCSSVFPYYFISYLLSVTHSMFSL
jgi:hypothetical protein